jgi:hypothetical protein
MKALFLLLAVFVFGLILGAHLQAPAKDLEQSS